MGFFDKLKDAADKLGDTVEKGVKTGSENYKKMTEKSRLKKEISQLETGINDVYVEIGKKFAEANPDNEEYAEFFTSIKDKAAQIEDLKNQLVALEDKLACPVCGASIPKEAKFCDKCGAKIETPVVEAEEVAEAAEEAAVGEIAEITEEKSE